jgi:hypothetical protein
MPIVPAGRPTGAGAVGIPEVPTRGDARQGSPPSRLSCRKSSASRSFAATGAREGESRVNIVSPAVDPECGLAALFGSPTKNR